MSASLKLPVTSFDHIRGKTSAAVDIVMYADFQCPHSKVAAEVLKSTFEYFQNDVCVVYRHFPLPFDHPLASMTALAAEASAVQGKFWEMHDALFINQDDITENSLMILAQEIKLNMNQFKSDMRNQELIEKVKSQFNSGIDSGVISTPTLFINGIRYDRPVSFEDLDIAVNEIIEEDRDFL